MKILQRKLNLVLLLMVLAIFLQAPSVHAENMPQVKTPEEFYTKVVEQIENGVGQAKYELLFDPSLINSQEIRGYAFEKGGYALEAKFSHWSYSCELTSTGAILSFKTGYFYTDTQDEQVRVVAKAIAKDCQGMTDYEKIKYVYDYIILNSEYDIRKDGAYYNLITGKSCCNGYAEAFLAIMEEMGIPCKYTVNSAHAWNTVYLNGAWYNIDTTWGDTGGDTISYEYFLKSNEDWTGEGPTEATASQSYVASDLEKRAEYPEYALKAKLQVYGKLVIPLGVVIIVLLFINVIAGGRTRSKIAKNEDKIRNLYKLPDE